MSSPSRPARRADRGLLILVGVVWLLVAAGAGFTYARLDAGVANGEDMVVVPGGRSVIGSNLTLPNRVGAAFATLDAFAIDVDEVTNDEFGAYVAAGGTRPGDWSSASPDPGTGAEAVDGVSWASADAYCRWLGKRLPTESEWETAGRGPIGLTYPWTNEVAVDAVPTGSAGASMYGVRDLTGGVWEWVGAVYEPVGAGMRVAKGGSADQPTDLAYRQVLNGNAVLTVGFRCATDVVEDETLPNLSAAVFRDDFTSSTSGWGTFEEPGAALSYDAAGTLRFSSRVGTTSTLVPAPTGQLGDAEVEVTVSASGNTASAVWGLALRAAEGKAYTFVLGDGEWRIGLLDGAASEPLRVLASGPLDFDLEGRHLLRARAIGPDLWFEVDGALVGNTNDSTLTSGFTGLFLQSPSEGEMDAEFDDIVIRAGAGRSFVDRSGS